MKAKAIHDRQYRQASKQQLLYLHYIGLLKLFSNPFLSLRRAWYRCLGDTLKAIVRQHSLRPACHILKIIGQWRTIRRNRHICIHQTGAFLPS